jgi:hypothetical protein|tara:strand:+ start:2726 stop:2995 length:270 start_codon:yes stop_codon:yes gene_type:complete
VKIKVTFFKRLFIILLVLIAVVAPYAWAWHVELSMEFNPYITFTNGWQTDVSPVKVYHYWLYMNVLSTVGMAILILFNLEKIIDYKGVS